MIEICKRLLKIKRDEFEKSLIQTMLFSSQFIMMHAQDFLDQRIIEHGFFTPQYETGSVENAITEIV